MRIRREEMNKKKNKKVNKKEYREQSNIQW
jgi:hypothetical protein